LTGDNTQEDKASSSTAITGDNTHEDKACISTAMTVDNTHEIKASTRTLFLSPPAKRQRFCPLIVQDEQFKPISFLAQVASKKCE
jgi:hypothetical protein